MTDQPLYLTSDPETYADKLKQRLLSINCSEEYAEQAKQDILARAVQVDSSWTANAILSGKVSQ